MDEALQALDSLEEMLPTPTLTAESCKGYTKEEMEKLIKVAGDYQHLVDTLMVHPALIYLIKESQANTPA